MCKTPIFVSGIGRSGTSAVIKAIAEHRQVVKPEKLGEAPFVAHFVKFLMDFEDESPARDYNIKNYQLNAVDRAAEFSRLLSILQYGHDISLPTVSGDFWTAKVSLNPEAYAKALKIFNEIRMIYVMRNGIEVVNSAKSFAGFAHLDFENLCNRWRDNINQCRYAHTEKNCSVIKHHELVRNPFEIFGKVFTDLGMDYDDASAQFISTNLFNSSFDKTSEISSTASVFDKRLDCWNDWSTIEKNTFISICDELMEEFDFQRPYQTAANSYHSISGLNDDVVKSKQVSRIEDKNIALPKDFNEKVNDAMNMNQFDYYSNPSIINNYFFMENPKVASTSILKGLQDFESGNVKPIDRKPHDRDDSPIPRMSSLSASQQAYMVSSSDVFRFTFVRNPYSRLLSAYLSKIAKPLRPKSEILAVINGVERKDIIDLNQDVSFEEFVEVVCSQKTNEMNAHWKPQNLQVLSDVIDYDFIGRFENLAVDYNYICRTVFRLTSADLTQSKNKTNSSSLLSDFYTGKIEKLVYEKFEKDFVRFEYHEDRTRSDSCSSLANQSSLG